MVDKKKKWIKKEAAEDKRKAIASQEDVSAPKKKPSTNGMIGKMYGKKSLEEK